MSLEVKDISKKLENFRLQGINFKLRRGETLGIVGASGSGKTTLFKILLRILKPDSGEYIVEGKEAFKLDRKEFARMVQGVFQNPSKTLNPRKKVEFLLKEPFLLHREIEGQPLDLLREVSLPEEIIKAYPGELSGGQLQRISLARALALKPLYLIADEPTSALDPTVQVQILRLLVEMQRKGKMGMVFISHDIKQVVYLSNRILVLLDGLVMEEGALEQVLEKPSPYTSYLFSPTGMAKREEEGACPFYSLCPIAREKCKKQIPPIRSTGRDHRVRCHFY